RHDVAMPVAVEVAQRHAVGSPADEIAFRRQESEQGTILQEFECRSSPATEPGRRRLLLHRCAPPATKHAAPPDSLKKKMRATAHPASVAIRPRGGSQDWPNSL